MDGHSDLPALSRRLSVPVTRYGGALEPKPATVFLHGVLGSPAMWKGVATDRSVGPSIGLPLPGHFPWRMDRVRTALALENFAFLDAYRDALLQSAADKVHIIAHSTGALVALRFAATFPEAVSRLTLVGAFASGVAAFRQSAMGRAVAIPYLGPTVFSSLYAFWTSSPPNYLYGLSTATSQKRADKPTPAELAMLQDLRRSDPEALREVALWLQHTSVEDDLESVFVPVTVLVSQDDPVVSVETQLSLVRALPHANAVLCSLGHLPMFEAPETMRKLILSSR